MSNDSEARVAKRMSTPTDPTAGEGLSEVLHTHRLHASMNHCLACHWRPTADAGSLAEQHARHVATVLEGHIAARESAAATRARAEALRDAAGALRSMAAQEFDAKGPMDARGAAIWDSASWLTERATALAPDTAGESA